jgi:hypothetical protein
MKKKCLWHSYQVEVLEDGQRLDGRRQTRNVGSLMVMMLLLLKLDQRDHPSGGEIVRKVLFDDLEQ